MQEFTVQERDELGWFKYPAVRGLQLDIIELGARVATRLLVEN